MILLESVQKKKAIFELENKKLQSNKSNKF